MDVLVVLRRPGDVREVAADRVLRALRTAGRAARVHEKQRVLSLHRLRLDGLPPVTLEQLVDEEVAPLDHLAL
jgi:hypothetical protein